MKRIVASIILLLSLASCRVLNFQTEPLLQENCQYHTMSGIEFEFDNLPIDQLDAGFNHIYVAQSKESKTLSVQYQGMKGKLTGTIIEKNYPKVYIWGHRPSPFRDSLLYDDGYEDLYLTSKQREIRDRRSKYIFHKAILSNCQIVYISVDSLAQYFDNPYLIEAAGLKIINNK